MDIYCSVYFTAVGSLREVFDGEINGKFIGIEELSSPTISVGLKHRQICFPLWFQRAWTSYVPLYPRAVLHICSQACGNPASSLHHPCDNYELLQARVFVSNSLILLIIIDHRCLPMFLKFSPSSIFFFCLLRCFSSEPRSSAQQAPAGELPLFLIPGVPSVSQTGRCSFHPVWWRGRHRKHSQAVQLGYGATCCIPPVALVIWSVWKSVCLCVCLCVLPLCRASSQPNHFGNGQRGGNIGLEKGKGYKSFTEALQSLHPEDLWCLTESNDKGKGGNNLCNSVCF